MYTIYNNKILIIGTFFNIKNMIIVYNSFVDFYICMIKDYNY